MASVLIFFVTSLAVGALAQDTTPAGPTQPGTTSSCNKWYTVKSGDSCFAVEQTFGITHAQFIAWNPAVSDDCLTNFWPNDAYCVGVDNTVETSPTSMSRISTSIQSITSSASSMSSLASTTSDVNTTYSIRNAITSYNLSTPTIDRSWPPTRTQTGQPSYCNKWYLVEGGDTCEIVYRKFASSISMDEL